MCVLNVCEQLTDDNANNLGRKVSWHWLPTRFQSLPNYLLTDGYSLRHDSAITFVINNYFWTHPEHSGNLNQSSFKGVQYKIPARESFYRACIARIDATSLKRHVFMEEDNCVLLNSVNIWKKKSRDIQNKCNMRRALRALYRDRYDIHAVDLWQTSFQYSKIMLSIYYSYVCHSWNCCC